MKKDSSEPMPSGKPSLSVALGVQSKNKKKLIKNPSLSSGPMIPEVMEKAKGGSIASEIRKKRMMALGGSVDLDENAEETQPDSYEDRNIAAATDDYDSELDLMSQPLDSNEHGDELSDEDAMDMISKIRSKMKSRI